MMVKLVIDFENASRHWWENGGQELWNGIAEGFDGSKVLVEFSIAESWIAEAAKLPGWDDGPEYAPHPVVVRPVDEDEEL